jgi:hypothetical protein
LLWSNLTEVWSWGEHVVEQIVGSSATGKPVALDEVRSANEFHAEPEPIRSA